MKNSVKERLIMFIQYKHLSKNKFEELCGLSKRYVSNISQSIQPDVVKKISLNFPELNMGWILTGEGEMLKTENEEPKTEVLHLQELIKAQSETISSQKLLIATLMDKIEGLQRALEERG